MARSIVLLMGSVGGVMACSAVEIPLNSQPDPMGPTEAASGELTPEPIDPFYLAIESERWGVMIDNARNVDVDTPLKVRKDDDDGRLRVHRALQYGVQSLVRLRDETCAAGLVSEATCAALKIPGWGYDYVSELATLEELQARSDWLGEALQPFVDAKCQVRDTGGWDQNCRVE